MEATDHLATLILAAREDAGFRRQVLALLRLPAAPRTAIVNTALHAMTLRGEPVALRQAVALLAADDAAAAARRALDDPASTEGERG